MKLERLPDINKPGLDGTAGKPSWPGSLDNDEVAFESDVDGVMVVALADPEEDMSDDTVNFDLRRKLLRKGMMMSDGVRR